MCRLVALTATNISNVETARISQLAMIASQASDSQNKDGWGIASSWGSYMKNSGSFLASGQEWIDHVVNSYARYTPVLAHLRNSSAGTSVTAKEAQPFVFGALVCMHNGRMDGSYNGWRSWQTGDANSDSWRVFSRLHQMMVEKNQWTIDAGLITEWLDAYEDSSAYVFVIASGPDIYIVRNNLRELHCIKCGNGFLITTSADAARFVRNSASLYGITAEFPDKEPSAFVHNRLYHIREGEHEINFDELDLHMKKGSRVWNTDTGFRNNYGYYEQQSYGTSGAQEATTQTTQAGTQEEQIAIEHINGAILLRPRNTIVDVINDDETRFSDETIDDDEAETWKNLISAGQQALDDRRIDEIIARNRSEQLISPRELVLELQRIQDRDDAIRKIKSIMNPIRDTMLAMYIDMYLLGFFSPQTVGISSNLTVINDLSDIPDSQIFEFLSELTAHPENHPTDKQARMILNKWNHAVPHSKEQAMIDQYFGKNLPITVDAGLALGIINTLPKVSVLSA